MLIPYLPLKKTSYKMILNVYVSSVWDREISLRDNCCYIFCYLALLHKSRKIFLD